MANHEFGIMQNDPLFSERYDLYEPEKYNCILIDDDFIEPIMVDLEGVDCFWHSVKIADKGLAYYGITLIPPNSMGALIRILSGKNQKEYDCLIGLAKQANEGGKYIIHYGI